MARQLRPLVAVFGDTHGKGRVGHGETTSSDVGAAPQSDLQIRCVHLAEGRFVHTKVHTFTATTGGALKRVEALSPRNIIQVQRVFGPDR